MSAGGTCSSVSINVTTSNASEKSVASVMSPQANLKFGFKSSADSTARPEKSRPINFFFGNRFPASHKNLPSPQPTSSNESNSIRSNFERIKRRYERYSYPQCSFLT